MNKMKKNLQSNILLLPALIAGFFCYLFPILIAFWKSLFLGTGTDFVGIQNYVDLFENEVFSLAVGNLFHLWAIIVPVNLVIGIFIEGVESKPVYAVYKDETFMMSLPKTGSSEVTIYFVRASAGES